MGETMKSCFGTLSILVFPFPSSFHISCRHFSLGKSNSNSVHKRKWEIEFPRFHPWSMGESLEGHAQCIYQLKILTTSDVSSYKQKKRSKLIPVKTALPCHCIPNFLPWVKNSVMLQHMSQELTAKNIYS